MVSQHRLTSAAYSFALYPTCINIMFKFNFDCASPSETTGPAQAKGADDTTAPKASGHKAQEIRLDEVWLLFHCMRHGHAGLVVGCSRRVHARCQLRISSAGHL